MSRSTRAATVSAMPVAVADPISDVRGQPLGPRRSSTCLEHLVYLPSFQISPLPTRISTRSTIGGSMSRRGDQLGVGRDRHALRMLRRCRPCSGVAFAVETMRVSGRSWAIAGTTATAPATTAVVSRPWGVRILMRRSLLAAGGGDHGGGTLKSTLRLRDVAPVGNAAAWPGEEVRERRRWVPRRERPSTRRYPCQRGTPFRHLVVRTGVIWLWSLREAQIVCGQVT